MSEALSEALWEAPSAIGPPIATAAGWSELREQRGYVEYTADSWGSAQTDDLFGTEEDLPQWQERALCAQTDPEAFFPEKGGSTREAKKICTGCEVKAECLEYALAHDERFGIWGGLSERERRRLKSLRRNAG